MERYASGLAGSFQPGRSTPYFVVVCRRSEWSFIAEFDIMEIISALLSVCCQCISIRLGPSNSVTHRHASMSVRSDPIERPA
jgi:hypothetical protein